MELNFVEKKRVAIKKGWIIAERSKTLSRADREKMLNAQTVEWNEFDPLLYSVPK